MLITARIHWIELVYTQSPILLQKSESHDTVCNLSACIWLVFYVYSFGLGYCWEIKVILCQWILKIASIVVGAMFAINSWGCSLCVLTWISLGGHVRSINLMYESLLWGELAKGRWFTLDAPVSPSHNILISIISVEYSWVWVQQWLQQRPCKPLWLAYSHNSW